MILSWSLVVQGDFVWVHVITSKFRVISGETPDAEEAQGQMALMRTVNDIQNHALLLKSMTSLGAW